ncbi:hypothetical protein KIN20_012586 [Parelaphostrongylus tenuis]|uniref:Uncharacterized protein n=1 Tax=Parelaphostrongylus tenuis TaxID=148309 RepID=A0AAD5QMW6_PARTN|nr:hypothetical protein KIN20_012586 [Parelaphostrongylus tenuis]
MDGCTSTLFGRHGNCKIWRSQIAVLRYFKLEKYGRFHAGSVLIMDGYQALRT